MKYVISILTYLSFVGIAFGQTSWTRLGGDAYYANDPRDIAVANDGVTYTIGGSGRELVKSTNQGDSWTHLGQTNVYCVGVKPDNSQIILIGVDNGGGDFKVRRTSDGGATWADVITPS